jgi:hypothetical protein
METTEAVSERRAEGNDAMTNAAMSLIRSARVEDYFGPAEVMEVRVHEVIVSLPGGETARAELAFALPYAPAAGDILLVIGKSGSHYAIGVLHGSGRTSLLFQGDVELRSVNGRLSLSGDQGVDVGGPELHIQTGSLRVIARDVLQKFESVFQRVSSLLRVHAGEAQTLVDKGTFTQSKSATILTEEAVTINGREIHLG